jgi:hypothetical protein
MARHFARSLRAPLGELLSLLPLAAAMVGLLGTAHAAGELLYTLECAGAVGGGRD